MRLSTVDGAWTRRIQSSLLGTGRFAKRATRRAQNFFQALGEADLLSRLQHKNIVPVYSLHKYGQYHLICMPFLGTMTLGDMVNAQPEAGSALSGRALISTLAAQASRTWKEEDNAASSASGAVVPPSSLRLCLTQCQCL